MSNPEKETIFENDFAYITSGGDVHLKKTSFFDDRKIATIDPEKVEEQVSEMENAFEDLTGKVGSFLDDVEEELSEQPEKAKASFESLLEEISNSSAIGDFEKLLSDARSKFDETVERAENAVSAGPEKEAEAENEESDKEMVPVAESEPAEKDSGKKPENAESEESAGEVTDEAPEDYYRKLAEKAEEISQVDDWAYVSMEFDMIENQWQEGPDTEDADISKFRATIDELRESFEEKKRAHYEEQKKLRLANLEKKKDLLRQLSEIVDNKEWTKTREVGKIRGRWEHLKPLPSGEAEKLQPRFDTLLATFDEHKVDRLVKQKQQEEDNLTGKLVILEKMEGFAVELDEKPDWKELDKKFNDLTRQFRKIGRVPSDKNQDVWDRYHTAQDTFHSLRFKHDSAYRNEIEKFLSKKKKLIDEAEALLDSDDLAEAARKVNKLHRRWKKVGNLPQKDENEMWDRFKAATDAFNQKKTDNADLLKEQEEENYREKLKLIDEADTLKESEEWDTAHKKFQKLMDRWKEIGPVPKRKSGKIWKKFKGAMDYFYDRRRDHFKEVKEERKDNLKEKEQVLASLSELKTHDDPIEAVELAKPLQEEFKKAGYVPIKHKNRLWKEYRECCDVIYDRFRAAKAAVDVVGRKNLDQFSADDIAGIRDKQNEANKLRKQISKLNGELIQMKESLSYFKPSGSGSSLLDDVKKRIENAEKDLSEKETRLAELETEIDKLKNEVE
ncbi:DUF349 domain-containing protein [Rhodohalobacter mucosus]|uniref:DUF349 domain-containing protein n=1 Tax=Rhodohalobacter mucosus TaxID=2079485 RepID=A0A316TTH2_9BACT|nr:DUF349 domain-containing protein [Rhodohalobacter mucosus]